MQHFKHERKVFEEWPTVALHAVTRILNSKYVTLHNILTPLAPICNAFSGQVPA